MKNSINIEWKIKLHIFISMILFFCKTLSAQDTLTLITGTKLIVEIKEVNDYYVLFTLWPDTTIITKLPLDRVQSTSYKGEKSNLFYLRPDEEKIVMENLPNSEDSIVAIAKADARQNYKNSNGAGTGTFFATVLGTPIVGIFVAMGTSSTPPPDARLNPPNKSLFKDPIYYKAYRKEAHKMKQARIWTGFGLGVVVDVLSAAIIYTEFQDSFDVY